jgi:hypothetical protein
MSVFAERSTRRRSRIATVVVPASRSLRVVAPDREGLLARDPHRHPHGGEQHEQGDDQDPHPQRSYSNHMRRPY